MADERAQIALNDLYQVVEYAIPFGAGGEYPELRDRLVGLELTVEQSAKLAELDALAIDIAVTFGLEDLWPGLLEDHPDKPLERWWWHLGAIRRGSYPLDRLPEHLRQVVESA